MSAPCRPHGRDLPCVRCENEARQGRALNARGCHCFDECRDKPIAEVTKWQHDAGCPVLAANKRLTFDAAVGALAARLQAERPS